MPMTTTHSEHAMSTLLSLAVRTVDGQRLGRVRDLRVSGFSSEAEVDAVEVGWRRRASLVVPWSMVELPAGTTPWVTVSVPLAELEQSPVATSPPQGPPAVPALWLRRDVLDSQVVDLSGSRLSRVSDILLVSDDPGAPRPLAVDLGLGALAARIGLGAVGRRMRPVVVAWDDLYLASEAGHRRELAVAAERLRHLEASTIAEIVARLRVEQASEVLQAVEPSHAATAIAASHENLRHRLLHALPPAHRDAVLRAVPDPLAHELTHLARLAGPGRRRLRRTEGWRVRRPREVNR
jgi:hypothetical protein